MKIFLVEDGMIGISAEREMSDKPSFLLRNGHGFGRLARHQENDRVKQYYFPSFQNRADLRMIVSM